MDAVVQGVDVLVHAVEHDDGVVQAVADDREEGGHDVRRDLELRPRVHAHDDGHDVEQRDDGHEGHLELVADGDEHHDERDGHHEGEDGAARDVGAPVRADRRHLVGRVGQSESSRHARGEGVGRARVRLGRAHEEAGGVAGLRRLDGGGGVAGLGEGVAHLGDGDVARAAERHLRAARELDAQVDAAHEQAHEGEHDEDGGDGKQDAAVLDELNLATEVATHPPRPPSGCRRRRSRRPPPCRGGRPRSRGSSR